MAAVLLGGLWKTTKTAPGEVVGGTQGIKAPSENKVRGGEQRREDLSKEDKTGVRFHDALGSSST